MPPVFPGRRRTASREGAHPTEVDPGPEESNCRGTGTGCLRNARAIHDHAVMQPLDAFAAGTPESKREQCVEEAGDAAQHHASGKAGGRAQVFEVGLAHRFGMFCEETPYAHGREA